MVKQDLLSELLCLNILQKAVTKMMEELRWAQNLSNTLTTS